MKKFIAFIGHLLGRGKVEIETLRKSEDSEETNVAEEFAKSVEDLDAALEKAKKPNGKTAPSFFFDDEKDSKESDESDDEDDEDEEDDEDDEDDKEDKGESKEEPKKSKKSKSMKKSVEDIVREDGAGEAIDVEPFLKSLVGAIDKRISEEFQALSERLSGMEDVLVKSARLSSATGVMLKSMTSAVDTIGNTVEDRKGLIKSVKVSERMFKSNGDEGSVVSYAEAQAALNTMAKSRKLTPSQVAIVEGRMSRGEELPSFFLSAISTVEK